MTAPVAIAFCTPVLLGAAIAVLEQQGLSSRRTAARPAPEHD